MNPGPLAVKWVGGGGGEADHWAVKEVYRDKEMVTTTGLVR